MEIVKLLIEKGAEINVKDKDGFSALIWAAKMGRLEIVKLLIEKGAENNVRENRNGFTALIWAVNNGELEVVKLLILKGSDLNIKDNENETALDIAVEKKHNDIVSVLKKAGAKKGSEIK